MKFTRLAIHLLIASAVLSENFAAGKTTKQPVPVRNSGRLQQPKKIAKQTTLTVSCNVAKATVTQDGIILGNAGNTFEVDPGSLVIEVSAPGYQSQRIKTVAKTNFSNRINVLLVKTPRKITPVAKPTAPVKIQQQARVPAASGKKIAPQKKRQELFGDDFAGTFGGPPPVVTTPQPRQQAVKPRQQAAQPRQQAPTYQPGYGPGQIPIPQQNYVQPGYQQQPYQQAPMLPGYSPGYPQYPTYPSYQAPPGYAPNPGYSPMYPGQGYGAPAYQNPSPYYYYPQQAAPPQMSAPIPPPMDLIPPQSAAEAPLPSVAEAPSQSGTPPTDELVPRVSSTKSSASRKSNPLIKFLPFGAGQYQNGNYLLGGAFTAAQGGALILYFMNSSSAATATTEAGKAIAARDTPGATQDDIDYYDQQASAQAAYAKSSGDNATLCLLGFGAAWAASSIEAAINAPSGKSRKKPRGRRRGLAFETGLHGDGIEAQLSYNF
jgi:hypothetical protein